MLGGPSRGLVLAEPAVAEVFQSRVGQTRTQCSLSYWASRDPSGLLPESRTEDRLATHPVSASFDDARDRKAFDPECGKGEVSEFLDFAPAICSFRHSSVKVPTGSRHAQVLAVAVGWSKMRAAASKPELESVFASSKVSLLN